MTCGIYLISCNGRPYVGQSINIEDRWKHHLALLKRGAHKNSVLQRTWDKYGRDAFTLTVLEECPSDTLTEREHYWCVRLDSYRTGCNLAAAAKSTFYARHHNDGTKEKLRFAQIDRVDAKRHFSELDVLDVWLRYMDGEACTSIGDVYGVNNKIVWYIVTRRYYREIDLPPLCRRKEHRRPGGGRKKRDKSIDAAELFAAAGVPIQAGTG